MATKPSVGTLPTSAYVLPQPPRATGEVLVVAPGRELAPALRAGSDAARSLGERLLPLVESQEQLAAELRERLVALDAMVAEAPRAQWKGVLLEALAVLDWSDAAQVDLLRQVRLASAGEQPLDVLALCTDVAAAVQTTAQPVFVRGGCSRPWWGSAPLLAELVTNALGLVAERTLGNGARSVEIDDGEHGLRLTIASAGEPVESVDAQSIARFRRAAERLCAVVRPGPLGAGANGMVIELLASDR
jgi:hypothetical protein